MVEMRDSTGGVPEGQVRGIDRASLVWDEESVVAHQVEVSARAFVDTKFDDGTRVSMRTSVTDLSDAPERRFLAIWVEALDSQGQLIADWKDVLRQPIGGSALRETTASTSLFIDAEYLEEFTTLRASVIPGGPHPGQLPTPIPIQVHKPAFKDQGLLVTHKRAEARGVEFLAGYETTIVEVAFRARAKPDSARKVHIAALDSDGLPVAAVGTYNLCDEDPETPGTYVFCADLYLPVVPARLIVSPEPKRTWDLPDLPDELFETDHTD